MEVTMTKIKHIALTTENPGEVTAFYKNAFDMEEIRLSDNSAVFLSGGYINLAILNWKTEKDPMDQTTRVYSTLGSKFKT